MTGIVPTVELRQEIDARGAAVLLRLLNPNGSGDVAPVPRLALTCEEATASLGLSVESFERHVTPTLRMCRIETMRRVPVSALQSWLEKNAKRT